jgi:NADPH:quinone reductase-like Zn-dependent oxidoreductase
MRALVYDQYGPPDVVHLGAVEPPVAGPRQLLVRVHASTVNSGDTRMRAARFPPGWAVLGRLAIGWSAPRKKVLGVEFAGVVEAVGAKVTGYRPGDRVVAHTGFGVGGHAELALVDTQGCVAPIPDGVGFAEAVALPFGGLTALTFLKRGAAVRPGERVLVIGASGAVGSASVQVAKQLGGLVTGVCSGANAELVRSLGAAEIIDYTRGAPSGQWDVVVDTVGQARVSELRRLLTPRGRLVLVAAGLPQMLAGPWVALTSRQRVFVGPSAESPDDLRLLLEWHARG